MNKVLVLLAGLLTAALGCSQSCPAVPLHCACPTGINSTDPVCINGSWVCQCVDGGATDGAAE